MLFCPKRFLHSKGPKNGICLVHYHGSAKEKSIFMTFRVKESFWPKDKVAIHEKLVFRSGVRFLFLFVLMDAILLKLDFQKRTSVLDNPPNGKLFVY